MYEDCRELAGGEEANGSSSKGKGNGMMGGDDFKSAYSFFPSHYVPQSSFSDVNQSSKLAVLDHLLKAIRAEGNKVVVVSNYIQTLDMLAVYLSQRNYQYLRLDGKTNANERGAIVDRFNASYSVDAFVFLLSAKAGGVSDKQTKRQGKKQVTEEDDCDSVCS